MASGSLTSSDQFHAQRGMTSLSCVLKTADSCAFKARHFTTGTDIKSPLFHYSEMQEVQLCQERNIRLPGEENQERLVPTMILASFRNFVFTLFATSVWSGSQVRIV